MPITNAGLLGAAELAANNAPATPYTAQTGRLAAVTITFCNRNSAEAKVRLGVTANTAPNSAEWSFYDHPVPGGRSIDVTRTVGPGQRVSASSNIANVSCTVNGLEETIG